MQRIVSGSPSEIDARSPHGNTSRMTNYATAVTAREMNISLHSFTA